MAYDDYGDIGDYSDFGDVGDIGDVPDYTPSPNPYRFSMRGSLFDTQSPNDLYNYRFNPDWNTPTGAGPTSSSDDTSVTGDERRKLLDYFGLGKPGVHQQAYTDYLANQPNPDNFKPSKGRRIAALLGGISQGFLGGDTRQALSVQHSILDEPYNDALQQYKIQGDRLKQAADIEQRDILNRTKQYWDTLRDMEEAKKLDVTSRRDQANEKYKLDRIQQMGTSKKWTTDADGNSILMAVMPDGSQMTSNLGKTGLTLREQEAIKSASKLDLFGKEEATRQANRLQLQAAGIQGRQISAAKLMRDKADLIKNYTYKWDDATSSLVGVNKSDPSDVIWTDISHLSKADQMQMAQDFKIQLKQIPGPTMETTTTKEPTKTGGVTSRTVRTPIGGQAPPPKAVTPRAAPAQETINHVQLSDGSFADIPDSKLAEAMRRDSGLKVLGVVGKR